MLSGLHTFILIRERAADADMCQVKTSVDVNCSRQRAEIKTDDMSVKKVHVAVKSILAGSLKSVSVNSGSVIYNKPKTLSIESVRIC